MALDLTLSIKADATQAKAELRAVETGITKVGTAAKQTEAPLQKTAMALSGFSTKADDAVGSVTKLEQTTKTLAASTQLSGDAWVEHQMALFKAEAALADTAARSKELSVAQAGLFQSVQLTSGALNLIGAALGAVLAVGALELKFLYDSARLYAEKSGYLDKHADAVDTVKVAWERMQISVGAVLVGSAGDFNGWLGVMRLGIDALGGILVGYVAQFIAAIETFKMGLGVMARMMPGGQIIMNVLGAGDDLSAAGRKAVQPRFDANPKGFTLGPLSQFGPSLDPLLDAFGGFHGGFAPRAPLGQGPTVEADAEQAYRNALARRKPPKPMPTLDYRLGLPGGVGTDVGSPQAPYDIPSLNYRLGLGSMPGENVGKPEPPYRQPSLLAGLLGSKQVRDSLSLAFAGGGIGALGGSVGDVFSATYAQRLQHARETNTPISGTTRAMGLAGMGIGAFTGGYGIGASTNKTKGALGGAASGAMAGAAFGPWGMAIGAGIGALGGFFGGRAADKKAQAQMETDRTALLAQYGGMAKLKDLAQSLGVSIGHAFDTTSPKVFNAMVDKLNAAIAVQQKRFELLKTTIEGLNKSGKLANNEQLAILTGAKRPEEKEALGAFLTGQIDNAIAGLARFAENTTFTTEKTASATAAAVTAVFAELSAEGFSTMEIMQRLGPVLQTLAQKFGEAGLKGGEAFEHLNHLAVLFADENVQRASESVAGLVQVLTALANTGLLTQEIFEGLAASIVDTYQALIAQGHSANDALLVIQPGLQRIWEIQKDFGFATDAATQALLDQAEAAGLIGEKFRDPMRQMVDAINHLIERLGVFIDDLHTMGDTAVNEFGRARDGADKTGTAIPRPTAVANSTAASSLAGGGDIVVNLTTTLDGQVLDQRTERVTRRLAAIGAIKTRALPGRSY